MQAFGLYSFIGGLMLTVLNHSIGGVMSGPETAINLETEHEEILLIEILFLLEDGCNVQLVNGLSITDGVLVGCELHRHNTIFHIQTENETLLRTIWTEGLAGIHFNVYGIPQIRIGEPSYCLVIHKVDFLI